MINSISSYALCDFLGLIDVPCKCKCALIYWTMLNSHDYFPTFSVCLQCMLSLQAIFIWVFNANHCFPIMLINIFLFLPNLNSVYTSPVKCSNIKCVNSHMCQSQNLVCCRTHQALIWIEKFAHQTIDDLKLFACLHRPHCLMKIVNYNLINQLNV